VKSSITEECLLIQQIICQHLLAGPLDNDNAGFYQEISNPVLFVENQLRWS
jgi:hypothetical protein